MDKSRQQIERKVKQKQNTNKPNRHPPKKIVFLKTAPDVQHSSSVHGIAVHTVVFASPISTWPLKTQAWFAHINAGSVFSQGNKETKRIAQ